MPAGAPTKYNPEICAEICAAISSSSKGLKRLCKENPHWPDRATIFLWRLRYPEFHDQYTTARISQVEAFIDDVTAIADDDSNDVVYGENGIRMNSEFVARSRIRIDTRKWIACKLAPKIYGDKIHHTGDIKLTHEEQLKELE